MPVYRMIDTTQILKEDWQKFLPIDKDSPLHEFECIESWSFQSQLEGLAKDLFHKLEENRSQ